jgi:NAD(P)-dependent dehydrogenase (short-subunit alcohol dehydrogenase family)
VRTPRVDAADLSVRIGATNEDNVRLIWHTQISDEPTAATQQAVVFKASDRSPRPGPAHQWNLSVEIVTVTTVDTGSDLEGKRALVTGASRGIGRAIALGLADAGCHIAGLARSAPALAALGKEVEARGRSFLPIELDLAEVNDIPAAAEHAWQWREGLDVLVNVAGIIVRTAPLAVTPTEWDDVFAVNVRGTFFLTQAVGSRMLDAEGGSIVTVTSLAGEVVTKAAISYQASKAALIQLTRALAVHWAPVVRVNAVAPGYVRTDLNAAWLEVMENRAYVLESTPLGRVGQPSDVVGAVRFLASPAAGYVTGQNLRVDGGWSLQ